MPRVTINTLAAYPSGEIVNLIDRPRRTIIRQFGGSKIRLKLPFGPQDVEYQDIGLEYKTVNRPGKKGILSAVNPKLRSVNFSAMVAHKPSGGKKPIQYILDDLTTIASEDHDVMVIFGVEALPFRSRLTKFDYKAVRRDVSGNIIQAQIDCQFDERVKYHQKIMALNAVEYDPDKDKVDETPPGGGGGGSEEEEDEPTVTVNCVAYGCPPPPVVYNHPENAPLGAITSN